MLVFFFFRVNLRGLETYNSEVNEYDGLKGMILIQPVPGS